PGSMYMRAWLAVAAASCGVLAVAAQAPAQGQAQRQSQGPGQTPTPAQGQTQTPSPDRATCGRAGDGGALSVARLDACTRVLAANPTGNELAAVVTFRAEAARELRRFDEAVRDATRAIGLQPTSFAHSVRALALSA